MQLTMSSGFGKEEKLNHLQNKLFDLNKENRDLKSKLLSLNEKEQNLKSTLSHIQQHHSEFETSYSTYISSLRIREKHLIAQYQLYKSLLENQLSQNEKNLNEEISQLKEDIKCKDELISKLSKHNSEIKQILSKNEIEWKFKEQEYENQLQLKENKLKEKMQSIQIFALHKKEELQHLQMTLDTLKNQVRIQEDLNENNIQQENVEINEDSQEETNIPNENVNISNYETDIDINLK